jgi:hypothetical protein
METHEDKLLIEYEFLLDPNIIFKPTLTIPLTKEQNLSDIENLVFSAGIIEGMNYWKLACPSEYAIEAGNLTAQQQEWWHDLFLNGLGEFYFKNNIDFTQANFLTVSSPSSKKPLPKSTTTPCNGDLISSSGGKDSAVTLELVAGMHTHQATFTQIINNPLRGPLEAAQLAGITENIIVHKKVDPLLIELSKSGNYLTGHVPFTAMHAFIELIVAKIYNFKNILVSCEASSSVGNLTYLGKEINHQYSKSIEFETKFREHTKNYLSEELNYFSVLRPLTELQIAILFAQHPQHFTSFRSCNNNIKEDSWCGKCSKCAFIYLILFPFIPEEDMLHIFGDNYFDHPEIQNYLYELVGLAEQKPFECVGTPKEAIQALQLTINKYTAQNKTVPVILQTLMDKLQLPFPLPTEKLLDQIEKEWNTNHYLPTEFMQILKKSFTEALHHARNQG